MLLKEILHIQHHIIIACRSDIQTESDPTEIPNYTVYNSSIFLIMQDTHMNVPPQYQIL